MTVADSLVPLGVAALGGLAIGIEREWSAKKDGERTRFGGVRTFLLLGLAGGLGGLLGREGAALLAAAVVAAAAALVVASYVVTALRGSIDATTEVAGVVALAAGVLAGTGRLAVASAVFAATALVLVEKSRMHSAIGRLRSEEIAAGARFAVLALVVLPLLPAEPIEAIGGLQARQLWGLVLLFSGISFAGYVALRATGSGRGLGVAGLLGGVVSSTATTINFAKESRERTDLSAPLAAGALAASAVMPLRVAIVALVIHPGVARALLPATLPALVLGALFVVRAWRRSEKKGGEARLEPPANPLRLFAAMQMTALFAAVLWLLSLARERFGELGLFTGAALLGLTDLDALALSTSRLATQSLAVEPAARALALGMLSNTLFKAVLGAVLGSARYRLIVGGGLALWAAIFAAAFFWI